jgi:cytochrome P450
MNHPVVERRRKTPTERKDLLTIMLEGEDSRTGEAMTDGSIAKNVSIIFTGNIKYLTDDVFVLHY